MNFSKALEEIKHGVKVRRAGWNGKGMWIALHNPSYTETCTLPYIIMYTACSNKVPWLASQTDLLAEDWETVP